MKKIEIILWSIYIIAIVIKYFLHIVQWGDNLVYYSIQSLGSFYMFLSLFLLNNVHLRGGLKDINVARKNKSILIGIAFTLSAFSLGFVVSIQVEYINFMAILPMLILLLPTIAILNIANKKQRNNPEDKFYSEVKKRCLTFISLAFYTLVAVLS